MAKQPTLALPLDMPDVCVLRTDLTTEQDLIIEVESPRTTAMCRRCGWTITECPGYDQTIELRY